MYVSDWIPPGTEADNKAKRDGARHPLAVFVIVISVMIAMVLAYSHAGQRLAFAAHAAFEPC